MPETFQLQGPDKSGKLVEGSARGRERAARRQQAALDGLRAHRDRAAGRQQPQPRAQDPGPLRPHQAEGRRGLLAPVRDDDQLRPLAAALAQHPRRADREQAARRRSSTRSASTSRRARRSRPALAKHPKAFNRLYVAMVRAGEVGGVLDSVLLRLADTIEKQVELRRKVKSAMTYPVVVVVPRAAARHRDAAVRHPDVPGDLQAARRHAARCRRRS